MATCTGLQTHTYTRANTHTHTHWWNWWRLALTLPDLCRPIRGEKLVVAQVSAPSTSQHPSLQRQSGRSQQVPGVPGGNVCVKVKLVLLVPESSTQTLPAGVTDSKFYLPNFVSDFHVLSTSKGSSVSPATMATRCSHYCVYADAATMQLLPRATLMWDPV